MYFMLIMAIQTLKNNDVFACVTAGVTLGISYSGVAAFVCLVEKDGMCFMVNAGVIFCVFL